MRRITIAFCLLCLITSAISAAEELPDSEAMGPWPVAVTTIQLDDHSRTDPERGGPRGLLTEIYYPATEDARSLLASAFSEFIPRGGGQEFVNAAEEALGGYREGFTLEAFDSEYRGTAVRDAQALRAGGH